MKYFISNSLRILVIFIAFLTTDSNLPNISLTFIYSFLVTLFFLSFFISRRIEVKENEDKESKKYDLWLKERRELRDQGRPQSYINGLGKNPLLKDFINKAKEYQSEFRFKETIILYKNLLINPDAKEEDRVEALNIIGNCYGELFELRNAMNSYKDALKKIKKIKNRDTIKKLKSIIKANMGLLWYWFGKLKKAKKLYIKALRYQKSQDSLKGNVATQFYNIGLVYTELGKSNLAKSYFEKALKIFEERGDERGKADQHSAIGHIEYSFGKLEEALEKHTTSLEIYLKIGYKKGIAHQHGEIGIIKSCFEYFNEAEDHFNSSSKYYKEIGDERGVGLNIGNIGLIKLATMKLKDALKNFKKALDIFKRIGYKIGIGEQYGNIGTYYFCIAGTSKNEDEKKEFFATSLKYQNKALKILEKCRKKRGIANSLCNMSLVYYEMGFQIKAIEFIKKGLNIFRQIGDQREIEKTLNTLSIFQKNSN
jgi:tetratricopeptide (TPR) repeat protein